MYKLSLSILLIFLSHTLLLADSPIKNAEKGENLRYVIHYGIIRGGKASLKIRREKIDGKDLYHATLTGKTIGLFNSLYKVKDTYESFINTETLLPVKAIRDIREGNYKRYTEIVFKTKGDFQIGYYQSGTKQTAFIVSGSIGSVTAFLQNPDKLKEIQTIINKGITLLKKK